MIIALVLSDGVDLLLKIVYDFERELGAQDPVEVDALVSGNRFVGGEFDAFLDLRCEKSICW